MLRATLLGLIAIIACLATISAQAAPPWATRPVPKRLDFPTVNEPPRVRSTTIAQKIAILKQVGVNALPSQLGPPFRLDMVTPYVAGRGNLGLVRAGDSLHTPGQYASFRGKIQVTDEGPAFEVVPGALIQLKSDPLRHYLIDCHVVTNAPLEFQIAPAISWWDPPVSSAIVLAQSSHVYFLAPKNAQAPWTYVRLRASAQHPVNQYWRFVGCDITPVGP
jgi:hypothetical protein